jgi:hypothetical protein
MTSEWTRDRRIIAGVLMETASRQSIGSAMTVPTGFLYRMGVRTTGKATMTTSKTVDGLEMAGLAATEETTMRGCPQRIVTVRTLEIQASLELTAWPNIKPEHQ